MTKKSQGKLIFEMILNESLQCKNNKLLTVFKILRRMKSEGQSTTSFKIQHHTETLHIYLSLILFNTIDNVCLSFYHQKFFIFKILEIWLRFTQCSDQSDSYLFYSNQTISLA